jgi:Flp pilus assembly protein TadD
MGWFDMVEARTRRAMTTRRVPPLALAVLLAVVSAAAAASPLETPAAAAVSATYVGSRACAPCHAKQFQDWLGSHHARAMQTADRRTVLGNFRDARFTQFGVTSRFFTRGDAFFVHTEGPDGGLADFQVTHTFGVDPLQQYLIELPGGWRQSLTIAWDTRPKTQGGQRWFSLYPNERIAPHDPLHWTGPDQNWNYMCASCHSTNLRKGYDPATRRYDTTWSDIDVGCEACHGPGSRHVERTQRPGGATPSAAAADLLALDERAAVQWPIDPATGNARPSLLRRPHVELEVCAPCHARRSVIADGFVPGAALLDAYLPALLTPGLYHADGQLEGEVYEYGSFLQSKMYRMGVTCSNCHEPHALSLRAPGNAVCAQCHLASKYDTPAHHFHPAGSAGASCAGCHMPTRTYMGVDPRHDHSLRIPRPDLSVTLGVPNPCTTCHRERSAEWARDQVRRWYGHDPRGYQAYANALAAGRSGAVDAEAQLATLVRDGEQPAIARATALTLLRSYMSPTALDAVRLALRDDDALVRRAALTALDAAPPPVRLELAAPLLADPVLAVRLEAVSDLASLPPDSVSAELRTQLERGIDAYVAAQRVEADRPEAHSNLGTLYAERGQFAVAESELREAIALRPDFTPAYVNLADVLRAQQRDADGERVLRSGLAAAPADAALHHSLGLLLIRQKQGRPAIDELQRAAELRPDVPRYSYVLGVGFESAGDTPRALDVLRAAHQHHPADRDLLTALVTINRDHGNTQDAQRYAQELQQLDSR